MTQAQLREVMKYHLDNFNDEGVAIDDNTIHNQVLSDSDGFGGANSRDIYKGVIRWTLWRNGHHDEPWPNNWMDITVAQLATSLLPEG